MLEEIGGPIPSNTGMQLLISCTRGTMQTLNTGQMVEAEHYLSPEARKEFHSTAAYLPALAIRSGLRSQSFIRPYDPLCSPRDGGTLFPFAFTPLPPQLFPLEGRLYFQTTSASKPCSG